MDWNSDICQVIDNGRQAFLMMGNMCVAARDDRGLAWDTRHRAVNASEAQIRSFRTSVEARHCPD